MIYNLDVEIKNKTVKQERNIEGTTTLIGIIDDVLTEFLFNDLIIKVTEVKSKND